MKTWTMLSRALIAAAVLQCISFGLLFVTVVVNGQSYKNGYRDAIQSAELIEMDGSGYAIRFGRGDDFQVHEYTFAEVNK